MWQLNTNALPKVSKASATLAIIAGVFLRQTLPMEMQLKIVMIR
jgi:hypothetical protein